MEGHLDTIADLNEIIRRGDFPQQVNTDELRHVERIVRIAERIAAMVPIVRLVLVAGPSSAGTTTTAIRLCTRLKENGMSAIHLSTDDYFVGDKRNPIGPDGKPDWETVEAVDRVRLVQDLASLFDGEPTYLRRFSFQDHDGYDAKEATTLPPGGVVVLEGIHALNPRLSSGVPDGWKYRVSIEPLTQPQVFGDARLPPADGRLLRRLVRDNLFRKAPPALTFAMWPKVLAGERKWIDPFRKEADATFDSGLEYELAAIKPYAAGLLELAKIALPEDPRPRTLSALLSSVLPADPTLVPGDSILRETIGGSLLEY